MRDEKKLVMGIGHRIKSVENPDKRVEILKKFVFDHFPDTKATPLCCRRRSTGWIDCHRFFCMLIRYSASRWRWRSLRRARSRT